MLRDVREKQATFLILTSFLNYPSYEGKHSLASWEAAGEQSRAQRLKSCPES
jgi:hypothetical protein